MIDDDNLDYLQAHLRQIYKDIENIDYQLADLHPKSRFEILQAFQDTIRFFPKKKTKEEIILENQKTEKTHEVEEVKERFIFLGGDIASIFKQPASVRNKKARRSSRAVR